MSHGRRNALKKLSLGAGSFAFGPFLRSVESQSESCPVDSPKRFVFVVKASGIDRPNLIPPQLDGGPDNSPETRVVDCDLTSQVLPDIFAPFESLKEYLTIVQGLSGSNFSGNHTAGYGALSCHNSERVPIAPTLDYLLGRQFSTGPFPMYGMAINGALLGQRTPPENGYCYPNLSARGKGQPIAFQASPEKAFMDLFGNAVMEPEEAQQRLTVKNNLMDFLREDARRIEAQLSPDESERFANYTNAFESLRVRENGKATLGVRVRRLAPEYTDLYASEIETERQLCQFEIATAALIVGLTNVVTLRPDTLGTVYTGLGFNAGLHAIGHGGSPAEGVDSETARREVDRHHLQLIAQMARELASVPEGDGNMLDNTLICYMSCAGGAHHGGQRDWPIVLVGGAGNRLRMGRYLHYPAYGEMGHKTIANLYMSILNAVHLEHDDQFGQLDSQLRDLDLSGPLDELMT